MHSSGGLGGSTARLVAMVTLAVTVLHAGCGSQPSGSSPTPSQAPAVPVTPIVPVASIAVTLNANGLAVGETTTATATARDASGNVLTGRSVVWASSDPTVATVSQAGVLTAVAAGNTSLVATSEGVSGGSELVVATRQDASVVLAVDPAMLPGIDRRLSEFMTDLARARYHVLQHAVTEKTPPQLRQSLRDYYGRLAPQLEGVIVVGSAPIPTATFDYPNPPGTVYSGPSMQYYMDLDGTFSFRGGDVINEIDAHFGRVEIEIWASILPMYGDTKATIERINNYLAKNHRYRSGQVAVQAGLVNPVLGSKITTESLYAYQYRVIKDEYLVALARRGNFFVGIDNLLGDPIRFPTSRVSYEQEMMTERYDVASIGAHGSYTSFGENNESGGIVIDVSYADTRPIKPVFLLEHSCNTAAIHKYPNLGSAFLYNKDNNVLVFAGATAPQGGMGNTSMGKADNYEASLLVAGRSVGVAHFAAMRLPYTAGVFANFREAFAAQQIILGDGTLTLQEFRR